MKRKIKTHEIILSVLVIILVVAGVFLPKTGPLVMLDEICFVLVIWIVFVYVILRMIQSRKKFSGFQKAVKILCIGVCMVLCLVFTRSVALDLLSGTKIIQLKDIQVSKIQGHTGIFSLHYYLTGTDSQDTSVRLEISGDDYTRLSGSSNVTVEYFSHTGRIVRYLSVR